MRRLPTSVSVTALPLAGRPGPRVGRKAEVRIAEQTKSANMRVMLMYRVSAAARALLRERDKAMSLATVCARLFQQRNNNR